MNNIFWRRLDDPDLACEYNKDYKPDYDTILTSMREHKYEWLVLDDCPELLGLIDEECCPENVFITLQNEDDFPYRLVKNIVNRWRCNFY